MSLCNQFVVVTGGISGGGPKDRGKRQYEDYDDLMEYDEDFEKATHEQIIWEAEKLPHKALREKIDLLTTAVEKDKQAALDKARELRQIRDRTKPPSLLSSFLAGQLSLEDYRSKLSDVLTLTAGVHGRFRDIYVEARTQEFRSLMSDLDDDYKQALAAKDTHTAFELAALVDGKEDKNALVSVDQLPRTSGEGRTKADRKKELKEIKKKQEEAAKATKRGPKYDIESTAPEDPNSLGPIYKVGNKALTPEQEATKALRDKEWRMVAYGKPPALDYMSVSVENRRSGNKDKADLIIEDLAVQGLKPSIHTFSNYMKVYSEANDMQALTIFERMCSMGFVPTQHEYGALARLYIRRNDFEAAMSIKETIVEKGLTPSPETYGLLVHSATCRNMLPEALLLVEEAAAKNIKLENRSLQNLRQRLKKLGISHPDMPPDPKQWVWDLKKIRFDKRHSSQRKIQAIRSAGYVK
jgi:hypothetical protein